MKNNSITQKYFFSFAIQTGVTIGFVLIQLSGYDIIIVKINCFIWFGLL